MPWYDIGILRLQYIKWDRAMVGPPETQGTSITTGIRRGGFKSQMRFVGVQQGSVLWHSLLIIVFKNMIVRKKPLRHAWHDLIQIIMSRGSHKPERSLDNF